MFNALPANGLDMIISALSDPSQLPTMPLYQQVSNNFLNPPLPPGHTELNTFIRKNKNPAYWRNDIESMMPNRAELLNRFMQVGQGIQPQPVYPTAPVF